MRGLLLMHICVLVKMAQVTYTLRKGEHKITGILKEKAEEESSFFQLFFEDIPDETGSIVINLDDEKVAAKYRNIKFEIYEVLCTYIKTSQPPDFIKHWRKCRKCKHVYDPATDDGKYHRDFEELSDYYWRCPVCAKKEIESPKYMYTEHNLTTDVELCDYFNALSFLAPEGKITQFVTDEIRRRLKQMYADKSGWIEQEKKERLRLLKKIETFEKNIKELVHQKHLFLQDKFPRIVSQEETDLWGQIISPFTDFNGFKTEETFAAYSPEYTIYLGPDADPGKSFTSGLTLKRLKYGTRSRVEIERTIPKSFLNDAFAERHGYPPNYWDVKNSWRDKTKHYGFHAPEYIKTEGIIESINGVLLSSEANKEKDPNDILKEVEENAIRDSIDGKPFITLKIAWLWAEDAVRYHNNFLLDTMITLLNRDLIHFAKNKLDKLLLAWQLYHKLQTVNGNVYPTPKFGTKEYTTVREYVFSKIVSLCNEAYPPVYELNMKYKVTVYTQMGGLKNGRKLIEPVQFLQSVRTAVNEGLEDVFKHLLESPMGLFYFARSGRSITEKDDSPPFEYEKHSKYETHAEGYQNPNPNVTPIVSEIVTYVAKFGTPKMFDLMAAMPTKNKSYKFDPYTYSCSLPADDMISAEDRKLLMKPTSAGSSLPFEWAEYFSPLYYAVLFNNGPAMSKIEAHFRNHWEAKERDHFQRHKDWVFMALCRTKPFKRDGHRAPSLNQDGNPFRLALSSTHQINCIDMFLKKSEQDLLEKQIVEEKAEAKQLKEKKKAERFREIEEKAASAAKKVKIAPSGGGSSSSGGGGPACNIVAAFVDMSLSPAKMSFKKK